MNYAMDSSLSTKEPRGAETLYDVLGVAETATIDEIKHAYFDLVRRFRPAENPEFFQRMNDASRTLADPRRRGEYDQSRRVGRRVQVLLDQAAAAQERDPQKSISLLKSAIALAPDMARPRHLLAQVLIRVREYGIAEKQYRWLLRENPRDEVLYFKLARCLWMQDRRADAETALRFALKYNALYHDALMLLSRLHETSGERSVVIETLEKAIANDGKENYSDLDALLRLYALYVAAQMEVEIEQTACRLVAVIPTEDEGRLLRAVTRLQKHAEDAFETQDFTLAAALHSVAIRLPAPNEEIAEALQALSARIALAAEAKQVQGDHLIEEALRDCMHLKYLDHTSDVQRRDRLESVLARLQSDINTRPRELGTAIEYLRREYPGIAADQNALLQGLVTRVVKRLEVIGPEKTASTTMPIVEERSEKTGLFGWLRKDNK